ncbi:hypothetical protein [Nocardia carnea]|uniref:hypothetical protein n=1 Tax=Nocardia carnea TaxID=37328 RepID=UPI0024560D95|nr:hypothetical protein [Nocardia carnea]
MRTHACGRRLSCARAWIATIDDGASKNVVRQGIRSPWRPVVCVGFVVTEVGVAVIVRVQSAELSGVQRFVLRLLGDWGRGSERIGGVALLGGALPRSRRRSATVIDLLVWTPSGCTLVVLADFRSVQHGVLETPSDGRWQVDDRAADLRTGSGTMNPLVRGRRQRADLAAVLRRHGLPEDIDILVVLIPKTGSRIAWTPPPQEAGEATIMVRIGQSAGLTEYFERPPAGAACWRAADIAQSFEILGIPLSTPDAEELAAEGFAVAGNGSALGALAAPPVPAGTRSVRKPIFPRFTGSGRTSTRPATGGAPGFTGRAGPESAEESGTEQVLSMTGSGPVPSPDDRTAPPGSARPEPPERQPSADAPASQSVGGTGRTGAAAGRRWDPDAFPRDAGEPDRSTDDERNNAAQQPGMISRPAVGEEQPPEFGTSPRFEATDRPAERGRLAGPGEPAEPDESGASGRPAESGRSVEPAERAELGRAAESGQPAEPEAGFHHPAGFPGLRLAEPGEPVHADRPAGTDLGEMGRPGQSAAHSPEDAVGVPASAAAEIRPPRRRGNVGSTRQQRSRWIATPGAEGSPVSPVTGLGFPSRGDDRPDSAGEFPAGGDVADRPADPAGSSAPGASAREPRWPVRTPAGIRRGFARLRQVPARVGGGVVAARAAGRPRGPETGRQVDQARPAGANAGGRGARYAIAIGVAGAALAAVTGTVFAASGFARFDVAEYGALCQGAGGTTVAAPYSAAGPSPIHLAGELAEFTPVGPAAVWHPVDARSVQLVACVSEERLGALVRTCQFPPAPGQQVGRTLNLFAMAYRLSVYEARTGNRLAAIDLTGERFAVDPAATDTDVCRAATGAPEDGLPGRRHGRLSQQQVQRALAPFAHPEAPQLRAAR